MGSSPEGIGTAADLIRAVALAQQGLEGSGSSAEDYRLVEARRVFGDESCAGSNCWRLVFKPARLIPGDSTGRLGAGGEAFFVVDVDAGRATLTGHGE